MHRNKWFTINEKDKTFKSKRVAKTKKEAWDKTLLKWGLIIDEYDCFDDDDSDCGFCNLYRKFGCTGCLLNDEPPLEPWMNFHCIPFSNSYPDLQYLWLLFVREATK